MNGMNIWIYLNSHNSSIVLPVLISISINYPNWLHDPHEHPLTIQEDQTWSTITDSTQGTLEGLAPYGLWAHVPLAPDSEEFLQDVQTGSSNAGYSVEQPINAVYPLVSIQKAMKKNDGNRPCFPVGSWLLIPWFDVAVVKSDGEVLKSPFPAKYQRLEYGWWPLDFI